MSADNLDEIVGCLFRSFWFARHVIANMVFHKSAHVPAMGWRALWRYFANHSNASRNCSVTSPLLSRPPAR